MTSRKYGDMEVREVPMAKTTVELPEVLHRKLRVKAALEDCSMNDIIVEALQGHLSDFRFEPRMLEVETVPAENRRRSGNGRATNR
jgi:plasmid stability protein